MARQMEKGQWNPYVAGALSGLVIVGSVWLTGKYAGASTTFVRGAGMIEQLFSPERIAQMEYFLKEKPIVDWQWMFVVGILVGSFIAALSSGSFTLQAVPDMWRARFGPSALKRGLAAFVGGTVAMYGARLADG